MLIHDYHCVKYAKLSLIRVFLRIEKTVSVFLRMRTESAILSICGKMRIRESAYSGIFYVV